MYRRNPHPVYGIVPEQASLTVVQPGSACADKAHLALVIRGPDIQPI